MYNFRINSANSVINLASYLAVVTSGIFLLGASSVQAQTAKYTAKIAHLEQATQPRHQGLERVAALVKERTKGEVEFKLYPSSQLGNARQMTEGVQFGAIESTVMPASFLGGFNPVVSVLDVPYVYPDGSCQRPEATQRTIWSGNSGVFPEQRGASHYDLGQWP